MRSRFRRATLFVILVVVLALTACSDSGWVDVKLETREWYNTHNILLPVRIDEGNPRFLQFTYEHNGVDGWITDIDRTMRLSGDMDVLIEFTAVDDAWDHRVIVSALATEGPSGDLRPMSWDERHFGIDLEAPVPPNASPASGSFDPVSPLWIDIDHDEWSVDDPQRSDVVVYAWEGELAAWNSVQEFWGPNDTRLWDGDGTYQYREIHFMAEDRAGNRSPVTTEIYETW